MTETKSLKVEIAAPDKRVFCGEAEIVVVPGAEGELGILPRHAYLMAALREGELRLTSRGNTRRFAVSAGFVEVTPGKVLVLADTAEEATEIDVERAKRARSRAREHLRSKGEVDVDRARLAILRAINRLKVAAGDPRR